VTALASPRTAEDALREHGLNGERVMKLARRIASDAQRRAPAGLGGKYEDLVGFLSLQALEAALRYDAAKSGNGYSFTSYLCDVMELRVDDFYRRKSEGFGDRRHGNDQRIVLVGDHAEDFDSEVDFERLLSERRMQAWHSAAQRLGLPFTEWVVQTLDQAAVVQAKVAVVQASVHTRSSASLGPVHVHNIGNNSTAAPVAT
jgi:DNA-directed RNA polymerase specialized sigma subunit